MLSGNPGIQAPSISTLFSFIGYMHFNSCHATISNVVEKPADDFTGSAIQLVFNLSMLHFLTLQLYAGHIDRLCEMRTCKNCIWLHVTWHPNFLLGSLRGGMFAWSMSPRKS